MNQDDTQGALGARGPAGATGATGAARAPGAPEANGTNGTNGSNGTNGVNGLNSATPVLAAGDAGWQLDRASIAGGELVLQGGFDNLVYNCFYNGDYQQSYDQNAMNGKWWSTHALTMPDATVQAVTSLQTIQAAYPDAVITQISVDNGDSSTGTTAATDFSAGVDNVLIGFRSSFDRYDFGG